MTPTLRAQLSKVRWHRATAVIAGVLLLSPLAIRSTLAATPAGTQQVFERDDRTELPAALCSARNAVGVGLRGSYFAQAGWHGTPALSRIDPAIDFDATLDRPAEVPVIRSVRWQGWVKAPISGRYRFHVGASHAHVRVARQDVVVEDREPVAIELEAGRFYPIVVEIDRVDAGSAAAVRLEWTAPHGARYLVPRALLFLPTDSVTPRT